MEPFEIKDLIVVKGKPGLWIPVRYIPSAKMVNVKNLVDEYDTFTTKLTNVEFIKNYNIFLNHGEMSLENVFGFIMDMEEKELVKMEELDSYDSLDVVDKFKMMNRLVPDYDPNRFKSYHLSKIIKWYKALSKGLSILNAGIVDPYSDPLGETKTSE